MRDHGSSVWGVYGVAGFVKYQSLGNDYLLVTPGTVPADGRTARAICDRRAGVGADGAIFLPPEGVGADGVIAVRTYNADGTDCARSANAARMVGLYYAASTVVVRTPGGDSSVRVLNRTTGLTSVAIGTPRLGDQLVLAVPGSVVTAHPVDNGNPHAVVFCDEVGPELAQAWGEPVAGHCAFTDRVNAEFVQVVDSGTLRMEVWERGAGHTSASGTGACAAASAAYALG
jgi:diaminopimelate epimerase